MEAHGLLRLQRKGIDLRGNAAIKARKSGLVAFPTVDFIADLPPALRKLSEGESRTLELTE